MDVSPVPVKRRFLWCVCNVVWRFYRAGSVRLAVGHAGEAGKALHGRAHLQGGPSTPPLAHGGRGLAAGPELHGTTRRGARALPASPRFGEPNLAPPIRR